MPATLYPGESYPGDDYSEQFPQNSILMPHIAATTVVRAPTLAASGSATVTVPKIAAATSVFTPALGHANQDINLNFITGTTVLYTIKLRGQPHGFSVALDDDALTAEPAWIQLDV